MHESATMPFSPTQTNAATQPTQRQRLMAFCAAHSRSLFAITETFADRFAAVFPASRGMFRIHTKTERFHFACAVASLCKNIDQFDSAWPAIETAESTLMSCGFTAEQMPAARACFIGAMREHAGENWNTQIEHDWCAVAERFFRCMTLPEAKAKPMRMAA